MIENSLVQISNEYFLLERFLQIKFVRVRPIPINTGSKGFTYE